MKNKFILFDFDGVIVDSFAPAFEVNKMMCPVMTEDDYRKRFEGNINNWIETEIKHDERCRHDIDFFTEYIPKMKNIIPFEGMTGVIKELTTSYTLIIISSTLTLPINKLLEKNALLKYFTEVMGNDVHKSKVEKIKMVFSKYNIDSKDCLFITDTLGDIREASHSGVDTIAVSWGFNTKETLSKGKPYRIIEKPENLISAINSYFIK
jgi:phosphoglycolate phosphatase-like HAD superfamily hydrolase